MIELEKTYLAKVVPDLSGCKWKEIIDVYVPDGTAHNTLRIRKNGNKYEITRKVPSGIDFSKMEETTITLNEEEFAVLSQIKGLRLRKKRYYYHVGEAMFEIDVFEEDLQGLVIVEIEFDSESKLQSFPMPDFCLVDVTQDDFIAGGMLCGKSYEDIRTHLEKYEYKRL